MSRLVFCFIIFTLREANVSHAYQQSPRLGPHQLAALARHQELSGRANMAYFLQSTDLMWAFGGKRVAINDEVYGDLWQYNLTTREWTWVQGTRNHEPTQSTSHHPWPGSRCCSASWTIVNRTTNLTRHFMYGGRGIGSNGELGLLSDFWEFIPANLYNLSFRFIGGSTAPWDRAKFLISRGREWIGGPHETWPGARERPVAWTTKGRFLWLFGGSGCAPQGKNCSASDDLAPLGDTWRYDTLSQSVDVELGSLRWAYLRGPKTHGDIAIFGNPVSGSFWTIT